MKKYLAFLLLSSSMATFAMENQENIENTSDLDKKSNLSFSQKSENLQETIFEKGEDRSDRLDRTRSRESSVDRIYETVDKYLGTDSLSKKVTTLLEKIQRQEEEIKAHKQEKIALDALKKTRDEEYEFQKRDLEQQMQKLSVTESKIKEIAAVLNYEAEEEAEKNIAVTMELNKVKSDLLTAEQDIRGLTDTITKYSASVKELKATLEKEEERHRKDTQSLIDTFGEKIEQTIISDYQKKLKIALEKPYRFKVIKSLSEAKKSPRTIKESFKIAFGELESDEENIINANKK